MKGCCYTVESINKGEKKVRINGFEYNEQELIGTFEPSYCTTVHCKQGDTIDGDYCIFDTNRVISFKMAGWDKWLYTALSRCTKWKHINIIR